MRLRLASPYSARALLCFIAALAFFAATSSLAVPQPSTQIKRSGYDDLSRISYKSLIGMYGGKSNARQRRQIPSHGRYRGQTQSQYMAVDSKDDGKAEAHSDAISSRATVSGSSGMGQAQSQTMYDPTCEECYGHLDLEAKNVRRPEDGTVLKPSYKHDDRGQDGTLGPNIIYRPSQEGAGSRPAHEGSGVYGYRPGNSLNGYMPVNKGNSDKLGPTHGIVNNKPAHGEGGNVPKQVDDSQGFSPPLAGGQGPKYSDTYGIRPSQVVGGYSPINGLRPIQENGAYMPAHESSSSKLEPTPGRGSYEPTQGGENGLRPFQSVSGYRPSLGDVGGLRPSQSGSDYRPRQGDADELRPTHIGGPYRPMVESGSGDLRPPEDVGSYSPRNRAPGDYMHTDAGGGLGPVQQGGGYVPTQWGSGGYRPSKERGSSYQPSARGTGAGRAPIIPDWPLSQNNMKDATYFCCVVGGLGSSYGHAQDGSNGYGTQYGISGQSGEGQSGAAGQSHLYDAEGRPIQPWGQDSARNQAEGNQNGKRLQPGGGLYGLSRQPEEEHYSTREKPVGRQYGTGEQFVGQMYDTGLQPERYGTGGTRRQPVMGQENYAEELYGSGRQPAEESYSARGQPVGRYYGIRQPGPGQYVEGDFTPDIPGGEQYGIGVQPGQYGVEEPRKPLGWRGHSTGSHFESGHYGTKQPTVGQYGTDEQFGGRPYRTETQPEGRMYVSGRQPVQYGQEVPGRTFEAGQYGIRGQPGGQKYETEGHYSQGEPDRRQHGTGSLYNIRGEPGGDQYIVRGTGVGQPTQYDTDNRPRGQSSNVGLEGHTAEGEYGRQGAPAGQYNPERDPDGPHRARGRLEGQYIEEKKLSYGIESEDIPKNASFTAATLDAYESDAQAIINQNHTGTAASASSRGSNKKMQAQTKVQGTYTGNGSFSAQAEITEENTIAQSGVQGGKEGAISSAQSRNRNNTSQASVQLGSETGSLQTSAQSADSLHSSSSKIEGSVKGGKADAQARGPGGTSSQAQIGFTPYKETDKAARDKLKAPFVGKGLASAQSSGLSGKSQSTLEGIFKYGISYSGAAQAGANLDKDPVLVNKQPFNSINLFEEQDKKFDVNTEIPLEVKPSTPYTETEIAGDEAMNSSESRHTHADHHKSKIPTQTTNRMVPLSSTRSFQPSYNVNGVDYEYTRGKDDNVGDDYYPDSDGEPSEYPSYDEYTRDAETHQSPYNPGNISFNSKAIAGPKIQHIVQDSLRGQNSELIQQDSEEHPDENRIYQPGEVVPGTGGYTIPLGFTGSVKSVNSNNKTYDFGGRGSPSRQMRKQTYPTYGRSINPKDLRSLNDTSTYVSMSKSVTQDLDSENNIRKQYSHTYYTKSSSCGYFTFTCTMVSGVDGKKKVCKPNIPTNPDGTRMKC